MVKLLLVIFFLSIGCLAWGENVQISSFEYRKYRAERSRDSNSQSSTVKYDGTYLYYGEEWTGYSPRGAINAQPARYKLSSDLTRKMMQYFNDSKLYLLHSKTEKKEVKTQALVSAEMTTARGHYLSIVGDDGQIFKFEYSAIDLDNDENPLNIELNKLDAMLKKLRFEKGSKLIDYTSKEREYFTHKRMHGFYPGEVPEQLHDLRFSLVIEEFGSTVGVRFTDLELTYDGASNIGYHKRVGYNRCTVLPETARLILNVLNAEKIPQMEKHNYLGSEPEKGDLKKEFAVSARFSSSSSSSWRFETKLIFYDNQKTRALDNKGKKLIPKIENLNNTIRNIIETQQCEKKFIK